jgi:hypothetical protein
MSAAVVPCNFVVLARIVFNQIKTSVHINALNLKIAISRDKNNVGQLQ